MKGGVYLDAEAPQLVQPHFAILKLRRGSRQRFPETCVELMADEATARAMANPAEDRHAAEVMGPSRSSEGVRLYYLVRWLEN